MNSTTTNTTETCGCFIESLQSDHAFCTAPGKYIVLRHPDNCMGTMEGPPAIHRTVCGRHLKGWIQSAEDLNNRDLHNYYEVIKGESKLKKLVQTSFSALTSNEALDQEVYMTNQKRQSVTLYSSHQKSAKGTSADTTRRTARHLIKTVRDIWKDGERGYVRGWVLYKGNPVSVKAVNAYFGLDWEGSLN